MLWLYKLLAWIYRTTPYTQVSQGATELTGGEERSCFVTYEINVSKDGKHVFATDSKIRSYSLEYIESLIKLFMISFPDCKIGVTPFGKHTPGIPQNILELVNQTNKLCGKNHLKDFPNSKKPDSPIGQK